MTNPGGHELAFQLPSLPERVWDALTNPVKVAGWFGENDLVAQAGHRFTIRPRPASGFDGPITGEVLAVEAPNRLVMRWRTTSGDLVMTWLVEPGKGGTRLRVIQSSVLGPGRAHEATFVGTQDIYRTLFDEQLRGFLRAGMLGRIQPPPRPKRPASLFEPAADLEPESSPVATFGAVPPDPDRRRDWEPKPHRSPDRPWSRGVVVAICAGVALAVALGSWAVASDSFSTWAAPGPQGRELSAATDATGTGASASAGGLGASAAPGGPGGSAGSGEPGPSGTGAMAPNPTPGGPAPTTAGPAPLALAYHSTLTPLAGYEVTVTVTNPAAVAQTWQTARVTLASLDLGVSNVDDTVTWSKTNRVVCFTPSEAIATVPANGAVTFEFYVNMLLPGVLGDVTSAALNDC